MNKRRKSGGVSAWLKKATLIDWLIIGGISVAAVAVIVISVVLFKKASSPTSTSNSISESGSVIVADPNADKKYDKDTNAIDKKEFSETILEKTKDAGEKYIDETLFIGDSNTVRMMSYGHTTLENDVAATSMGIQHVAAKAVVLFAGINDPVTVPKAVQIMQPKRIVLTYGTNNTIGWTTKTFVDEYKKAINSITKAYPHADIIINSVPPVDKIRENPNVTMQTIDAFNSALAKMAKAEGYKFLNSAEALKDEKHGFAKTDYTISDGIHLSKKGMNALFEYIRTHPYETEDRRPKPLKAIPKRKETPPNIITEDPLFDRTQKEKGVKIEFVNANSDIGSIEGETEQTVEVGKECETVIAKASEGYAFKSWACTIGRIENTASTSLKFLVPESKETITVTASFEKAYLLLSNSSGKNVNTISLEPTKTFKPAVSFAPASYSHSRDYAGTTSDAAVATVSADGTITAVANGTCVITYQALSGKLTAKITVNVAKQQNPLTGITATGVSLKIGASGQILIVYSPADASDKPAASFTSSDTSVATVDATGVVHGIKKGTSTITVTVGSFTATCTVTVTADAPPSTSISVPSSSSDTSVPPASSDTGVPPASSDVVVPPASSTTSVVEPTP